VGAVNCTQKAEAHFCSSVQFITSLINIQTAKKKKKRKEKQERRKHLMKRAGDVAPW
jgi:hypothetical protein